MPCAIAIANPNIVSDILTLLSPIPLMVLGFALHGELEVITDVGLSPYEALMTSTYNPAMYLKGLFKKKD
jgi:hypothetical protein